jgi:hypothetical protein
VVVEVYYVEGFEELWDGPVESGSRFPIVDVMARLPESFHALHPIFSNPTWPPLREVRAVEDPHINLDPTG